MVYDQFVGYCDLLLVLASLPALHRKSKEPKKSSLKLQNIKFKLVFYLDTTRAFHSTRKEDVSLEKSQIFYLRLLTHVRHTFGKRRKEE
jgi:hypothetical protein